MLSLIKMLSRRNVSYRWYRFSQSIFLSNAMKVAYLVFHVFEQTTN